MSESGFKEWFEAQYDGLPDSVRLRQLKSELQSHLNAIQKLGSEQQELERLEQAWTDSLYGWQARGLKMAESLRDAEISRLRAENASLTRLLGDESPDLSIMRERDEARAEVERLRKLLKMFRDGYDCDADAHQHGTPCRCCLASAALAGSGNELVDI